MRYLQYIAVLILAALVLSSCEGGVIQNNIEKNTTNPENGNNAVVDIVNKTELSEEVKLNDSETKKEFKEVVEIEPTNEVVVKEENSITTVNAVEAQTIKLSPQAVDPDGKKISFTYSSPFNSNGEWKTKVGDAGEYLIEVIASDGNSESTYKIKVLVENLNRAPVLGKVNDVQVNEGETIVVKPLAVDPDGNELTYTYSGYLSGPVKQTGFEDSGEYKATVSVSDGKLSDSQTFKIFVTNVNRAPVIEDPGNVIAVEGDPIRPEIKATDADGDKLTWTFTGGNFDKNGLWQTKIGDEGVYDIVVSVTDGSETTKQAFTVLLQPKNKAPEFVLVGGKSPDSNLEFSVQENSTLELNIQAKDADGDQITYGISGTLPEGSSFDSSSNTLTWTPGFNTVNSDQGNKKFEVTFKISDGFIEKTLPATITVENYNRPPKFIGVDANVE